MGIKILLNHLNRRDTRLFPYFTKLTLILLLISSVFFVGKILAQGSTFKEVQDAINEGTNQEAWLDNGANTNTVSFTRMIAGNIPDEVLNGEPVTWIPSGAIGNTSGIVANLYTKQASGVEYIASAKDSFLGKPAYAQGTGFNGLQPLLPIWRGLRNVTYILSSLVFIIIGLLIVLRIKISQQAVISIQNAIPQLISTLLLITFSYAIAGLLIDLSYIIQGVAISTLFNSTGTNLSDGLLAPTGTQWLHSAYSNFIGGSYEAYNFTDLMSENGFLQTFDLASRLIPTGTFSIIGAIIGGVIAGIIVPNPATAAVGALGGASLVVLIICIIVLFNLIKLLLGLIKVYVTVLLKIILAPLEIGIGAFPGSKVGFTSWINDLVANLAVFPITLIFLVLVNLIMETILKGSLWAPPIMGVAGTAMGGRLIAGLFGLGAFILLAKLPEMIPQYIFMIKPNPWGQAIGEPLTKMSQTAEAGAYQAGHNKLRSIYDTASAGGKVGPFEKGAKFISDILETTGKARK